ncbi:MAG: SLBB domain-containing protein [Schleiferiaceae bacterium]|nr:SLBB domain-containing protein [Schleiferiaceae bacterium]
MRFPRFLAVLAFALSATLAAQDLSGIKVDNLSDSEIRNILNQGQAKGLDVSQGEQLALGMGLPAGEAAKFKDRVAKLNSGGTTKTAGVSAPTKAVDTEVAEKNDAANAKAAAEAGKEDPNAAQSAGPATIYGQQLFRNGTLKIFERSQDIAAPGNYLLGEGDVLGVSAYGSAFFNNTYTIDSRGFITMEGMGKLQLRGITFEEATKLVKGMLSRRIDFSSNQFNLTLATSRTLTVNVVGEVQNPGSYKLPAINTAFNALMAAGGPTNLGTLRAIKIMREGKVIKTLDVYEFMLYPDSKLDFYLQDNDYIAVGMAERLVTVGGAIQRPMTYELKANENLKNLLDLAGGFAPDAYRGKLQIKRVSGKEYKLIDVDATQFATMTLERGDQVAVAKITDRMSDYVDVQGAVYLPQRLAYIPGMTVNQALASAGGLLPDVVLDKAYLTRVKSDLTLEFIPFDLSATTPVLSNKDKITIVAKPDYDKGLNITVDGAVRNAVNTPFAEGMTLGDALRLAGGLLPNADYSRVEVSRLNAFSEFQKGTNRETRITALLTEVPRELSRDLTADSEALKFALQPYDQIIVREIPEYKLQEMVFIGGEVQYPGYYAISGRDERLANVVYRAGGPTRYADLRNAQMSRIDAPFVVVELKKALSARRSPYNYVLIPGDSLFVPKQDNLISIVGNGHGFFEGTRNLEINAPFVGRKSARFYVKEFALGFAEKADRSKVYVSYPNGKLSETVDFGVIKFYPKISKGATLFVGTKPEKEKEKRERKPFDMNQAVATVTASLTSFATLYVLLTR